MRSCVHGTTVALGLLAVSAAAAHAQTLTSRLSTLNYNYVFGAGADTHTDTITITDPALQLSDTKSTSFSDATSGVLPGGQPYSAGVLTSLQHEYGVAGLLSQFQAITASASSRASAATSGLGSALLVASNPGNEIIFDFTVAQPVDYHLTGSITLPAASAFSFVALQRFDGIVWQNSPFNSIFLPNGQGGFDVSGTLQPGSYRVRSALALNAHPGDDFTASYNYQLTVPEPGVMALLGLGVTSLVRRNRATVGRGR
jgi:hypothetical protein